jgi:pyruvyltransferase
MINRILNFCKDKNLFLSIRVAFSNEYIIFFSSLENNNSNFGDKLNQYILNKILKKKVVFSYKIFNFFNKKVYSFIGSILDYSRIKNLVVLGSGYINEFSNNAVLPKKIKLIRGPLSLSKYNYLSKQNIEAPFGDPSVLVKNIFNPTLKKIYDFGIIPHYVDKESKGLLMLIDSIISKGFSYCLIDVNARTEDILSLIIQSKRIVSSSLHGLIISDLYSTPNCWVKFSQNIFGGNFKFYDYYLSLNKTNKKPIFLDDQFDFDTFDKELIFENIDLSPLIDNVNNSLPFDLL